jgi:hypothetical protein
VVAGTAVVHASVAVVLVVEAERLEIQVVCAWVVGGRRTRKSAIDKKTANDFDMKTKPSTSGQRGEGDAFLLAKNEINYR